MQSVPRFSVIDNHQRPIPGLNPIHSKASDGANVDEMLEVQIKMNAEIMKRMETFENEKKDLEATIKMLQVECDKFKKQSAVYKARLDNVKLDAKAGSSENKENMNKSNEPNQTSN